MNPLASLLALYRLLSGRRRRELGITLLVMLVGAAAEMMTIGAALAFLAVVAAPEAAGVSTGIRASLAPLGAASVGGASMLLIGAAVGLTGVRFLLLWLSQKLVTGLA